MLCEWLANVETSAVYRIHVNQVGSDDENHNATDLQTYKHQIPAISIGDLLNINSADGQVGEFLPGRYTAEAFEDNMAGLVWLNGQARLDYRLQRHFFPDSTTIRFHFTLTNPAASEHPGGLWDLGEANSVLLQDCSIRVPFTGKGPVEIAFSPECGSPFAIHHGPLELYQDSSGGENWQSTNHICRSRKVPNAFRGYRLKSKDGEIRGNRATPIVSLRRGDQHLSVSLPYFWQNFPKAIEADEKGITLRLFPKQSAEPHELQEGEQKTYVFYIAFGQDSVTDEPLAWTRNPIVPVVDPTWVALTKAVPYMTPRATDPNSAYLQLVDAAIDGDDTFEKKREVIDEYGWRHFGEVYGDHEANLHVEAGAKPRVSHYNNQYDCIAGFAYQWLRSGDVRWFRMMDELAHHVRDIDIYNTDHDKAAYNHGLFWHTYHYVDADTGTHRSYPKNGRIPPNGKPVPGGGPGNEQNYSYGLMLHYFLTGDPDCKEAALGLAQWVIDMDDGSKTVFRWLCRGDTGLASASRSPNYHGPGRGAANSVAVLLNGHRLTGNRKFLKKAEQLIRRVIHPADDVTQMVGMIRDGKVYVDAENRWFYVMFLSSLGQYLDHKVDLGERDADYAYARASLLHYARWMVEHEYPYLSRPEVLEYPTETWAAQDMWKSDVFKFAGLHATGAERDRFFERAEYFFTASVGTLSALPTKTLCRPVVLMLGHGWMQNWFAQHPDDARPAPAIAVTDFGRRTVFVPQKAIAMKRAKRLAAVGLLIGLVCIVAILWSLLR